MQDHDVSSQSSDELESGPPSAEDESGAANVVPSPSDDESPAEADSTGPGSAEPKAVDRDIDGQRDDHVEPADHGRPESRAAEEIAVHLAALTAAVDRLSAETKAHHQRAEAQETAMISMQQHIERLREDQVRALLKPVVIALSDLHADAYRSQAMANAEMTPTQVARDYAYFADQVEMALERLGFDSLQAAKGDAFDAQRHTAVKAIETDDDALDRRIAHVVRQGFTAPEDARPLLYAQVHVYRYAAPAPGNSESAMPADPAATIPATSEASDSVVRQTTVGADRPDQPVGANPGTPDLPNYSSKDGSDE